MNCVYVMFCAVYHATVEDGNVISAFLLLLGFNVLFAIIASAFIVIEVITTNHHASNVQSAFSFEVLLT